MSLLLRYQPSLATINPNVFSSSSLPLFFSSTTSPADSTACYPWVISVCARVPVCHISPSACSFLPLPLSPPFRTGAHHPSFPLCSFFIYPTASENDSVWLTDSFNEMGKMNIWSREYYQERTVDCTLLTVRATAKWKLELWFKLFIQWNRNKIYLFVLNLAALETWKYFGNKRTIYYIPHFFFIPNPVYDFFFFVFFLVSLSFVKKK